MTINRFIFILFALGLLSACAKNPVTDKSNPSPLSKQPESSVGAA